MWFLNNKELEILRENAKVHKEVFEEIQKRAKPWVTATEINTLCGDICKKYNVLPAFKWFWWFPSNICISVNDVVVHWIARKNIIFKEGDVVKFDFWVKDKKVGVNTDACITMIIGDWPHDKEIVRFLEVNKEALRRAVKQARHGNKTWDIGHAVQSYVEKEGFHVIKELTGHGLWKTLHEKPYIYNYGKPWTGDKLKAGMLVAIEPIIGFSSGKIYDKGDWEIYIEWGSIGSQFEHTVLITDGNPEIII
jgi:methionyl aminopeptidase